MKTEDLIKDILLEEIEKTKNAKQSMNGENRIYTEGALNGLYIALSLTEEKHKENQRRKEEEKR